MFSVVVGTCNRAEKLRNLLGSFEGMRVPDGAQWELIVVDNNSTDGTAPLLEEYAAKATLPLRHSFEPQRGLSVAHNHAIALARGDIIVFTDDDCRVSEDWLTAVAREFGIDSQLTVLGGRVELFNPADRAITIRTSRERVELTGDNRAMDFLIGCNIAFRRTAIDSLGGFDTRFGVGGSTVPSCGDLDFIYRIVRAGVRIVYSPDFMVLHDHGRTTDEQVVTLQQRYLMGRGGIYAKYVLEGDGTMRRMLYWELRRLIAGLARPTERRACLMALTFLFKGAGRFVHGRHTTIQPSRPQRT